MNKKLLYLISVFCMFVLYLSLTSSSGGQVGLSTTGCSCHGSANTATTVAITGMPATYVNGQAYTLTLTVTNASKTEAGFNLSVNGGAVSNAPANTSVNGNSELYHVAPQALVSGTTSWAFTWTAPTSGNATVTMFAAGNAVNGTGTTSGDAYNLTSITSAGPTSTALSVTASKTNVTCNGLSNGTITATGTNGTAPYEYKIMGTIYQASNVFNGVNNGTYTLTIKDAVNATATTVVTITQPTVLSLSINAINILCFGNTGTVTAIPVGGTAPYTYNWLPVSSTMVSINNANAGTYTCTITDSKGCTASSTAIITQPSSAISITSQITNVTCNGGNNGSATASSIGGTGTLSYVWAGIGVGATANNLAAGTYTCAVSDANGCTKTTTVIISQPTPISLTTSVVNNVSCNGLANGTASASVSGNFAPFTTIWQPGNITGLNLSNVVAGTYSCITNDANACTKSSTIIITQPSAITTNILTNGKVNCKNNTDGFITVNVNGGNPAYTYLWSPNGGGNNAIANLAPATYTCVITDASNCTTSITQSIATTTDTANAGFTQVNNLLTALQPSATSYQWITCNPFAKISNATQQSFTIQNSADYNVIVTKGSCIDTGVCKTIFPLSINNNFKKESSLYMGEMQNYIYENNDAFTIEYKIINTKGILVQQGKFVVGKNSIATIGYATGIYYVLVNNKSYKIMILN